MKGAWKIPFMKVLTVVLSGVWGRTTNPLKIQGVLAHQPVTTPTHLC